MENGAPVLCTRAYSFPQTTTKFTPCLCFSKCSGSFHTLTASWTETKQAEEMSTFTTDRHMPACAEAV